MIREGVRRLIGLAALVGAAACGAEGGALRDGVVIGVGADRYLTELPRRPDLGKYPLNAGVCDTLVRMTETFGIEPMLAERWTYDEAANTWRFFLRRDVRFHDGAPLTADDVKFTFDLISTADPSNYQQLGPASLAVVDAHTVDVTPMRPNRRLAEQIAHPIWGINRRGTDVRRPICTGPFRFVDYVKHDQLIVERHDPYWRADRRAASARLTFRFVPDAHARFLAVRAGQINLAADPPPEILPGIAGDARLRVVRSAPGASNALTINIRGDGAYMRGREAVVRSAIARAIDRRALVQRVWGDAAEPSETWLSPAVFGPYRHLLAGVPHDPAGAARALEDAGWSSGSDGIRARGGERLVMGLLVGFPPAEHLTAPELVQQQLRAIGIDLGIELAPDPGVFASRRRAGQFDLIQTIVNQNDPYPCFLPDLLHFSGSRSATTRFVSPGAGVDRAVERCRAAPSLEAARRHAAEAIVALVEQAHVVVPIAGLYRVFVTTNRIEGLVPHPSNTNQRWESVALAAR